MQHEYNKTKRLMAYALKFIYVLVKYFSIVWFEGDKREIEKVLDISSFLATLVI